MVFIKFPCDFQKGHKKEDINVSFDTLMLTIFNLDPVKRDRVLGGEKVNVVVKIGKRKKLIKWRHVVSPHVYYVDSCPCCGK